MSYRGTAAWRWTSRARVRHFLAFSIQGVIPVEQRITVDYDLSVSEVFWAAIRKAVPPSEHPHVFDDFIIEMTQLAGDMGLSIDPHEIEDSVRITLDERGEDWPTSEALTTEPVLK